MARTNNPRYLIAHTTMLPVVALSKCVAPPKEREADFREVLADYERRKATIRKPSRNSSIPKPYFLLIPEESRVFGASRVHHVPIFGSLRAKFDGVGDLYSLSDDFFNNNRTLALASVSTWCGDDCAGSSWKGFAKTEAGQWKQWTGWSCMTRSKNETKVAPPN